MSSNHQKDKRTKEQLLQILSNALTQEEQLGEKIKMLESQLAACQKQQEEVQTETDPYRLSASKESFRIDYYKASQNGRLKGIIEHLPSRQKKSFQGVGSKHITPFMERFLPEEAKQKMVGEALPPIKAKAPVVPEASTGGLESNLAHRLRIQQQNEQLETASGPVTVVRPAVPAPTPYRSSYMERIQVKFAATLPAEEGVAGSVDAEPPLLERLQSAFRVETTRTLDAIS